MEVHRFKIDGLLEFIPNVFKDERGEFVETYNQPLFSSLGLKDTFIQDNQSISHKGVFRGIHLQSGDSVQGKLVRVANGSVIDFAIDLRPESKTYGEWESLLISSKIGNQFWIPPGFGHAFLSLEDNTMFCYKCTNVYDPNAQVCIRWDDTDLNLDLNVYLDGQPLISPKDMEGISFKQYSKKYK
jgi:dTDP-4-dehydrorhamnose 3,5-epimerase